MTRKTVRHSLVLVLATLVFAAGCSGGDEEPLDATARATDAGDTEQSTTSATSTTDEGTASTEATDTDDGTSETSTSAAPATSEQATTAAGDPDGTASAPTAPAETSAPTPARPIVPRSGTYTFERTTTSDDGTETDTHDTEVTRLSGDDRDGRVQVTVDSEQGTLTNDASVSDAGTLVEHSVIESPLGSIDCDWEPDWLLHGAFVRGSTWDIDTSCKDTATGLEVDVAITGSGAVIGFEEVDLNGTAVMAWVLETTMVTEFTVSSPTLSGTQRSESTSRSWIDPELGMQVRDETRNTNTGDFENGTSEVVSVFVGFSPA